MLGLKRSISISKRHSGEKSDKNKSGVLIGGGSYSLSSNSGMQGNGKIIYGI
jgi:hypothetical protein